MPHPKKAAKKSAKKAAKKAAGHHQDKHHQTNDLRRAYEHMGRLEVLRKSLNSSAADAIEQLTMLAQGQIKDGHSKDSADLLRASEHLSFAALAGEVSAAGPLSAELEQAIAEKFADLTRKADEHWEEGQQSSILSGLYQTSRNSAAKAFKARAFHQALEFARAAEALTHVKLHGSLKLETSKSTRQLKSA